MAEELPAAAPSPSQRRPRSQRRIHRRAVTAGVSGAATVALVAGALAQANGASAARTAPTGSISVGGPVGAATQSPNPTKGPGVVESLPLINKRTPTPVPTVTVTASPEPAQTVTVVATPEPAPTVTVTAPPPQAGDAQAPSTATTPALRLTMSFVRTGRQLALSVKLDGFVHEPYGATTNAPLSYPTPASRAIGLGETLDWGDGTSSDAAAPAGQRCPRGDEARTLHQVQDSYTLDKTYSRAGEYTITYSYFACGLADGGKIIGVLKIKVP